MSVVPSVSCVHPISIKIAKPYTGYKDLGNRYLSLVVGCGHCIACKMKRTRQWTLRLVMESQYWKKESICFVTLTYDDDHLNYYVRDHRHRESTVYKRDVQNFFKRLRRRLAYPIRHFTVSEYGERTTRPHYHSVIFGLQPKDWRFINECWTNGFTLTKSFYKETAGYVAGYIQKKLFGKDPYGVRTPPFLLCSQHLGEQYFWDHVDTICKQGFIVMDGFKYGIPRIFARKAIERGFLPEVDLEQLQLQQNLEMCEFLDWANANNIELSDYDRNFTQIMQNRFTRSNLSRDLNEVV